MSAEELLKKLIKDAVTEVMAEQRAAEIDVPPRIYGVVNIAKFFHVSEPTVRRWRKSWLGPAITETPTETIRARRVEMDTLKALELRKNTGMFV